VFTHQRARVVGTALQRIADIDPTRNAFPSATATLRSQRSWPMRLIGLPSV
jgi:hypothetical protein